MLLGRNYSDKGYIIWAFGLLLVSMIFPKLAENVWFSIVVRIREAAVTGDSGHLILSAVFSNILFSILSTLIFMCISLTMVLLRNRYKLSAAYTLILQVCSFIGINIMIAKAYSIPWEPITTTAALILLLALAKSWRDNKWYMLEETMMSIQVFFAFQWLNIMPLFSVYSFGQSDIPLSIKITGMYINSTSMLNFIGFSFFLPFAFSALLTTTLFRSYGRIIHMERENHQKENELQAMKAKVIENRIYQEINLLAHDLKTPLVTIRGLNSLITMTNEPSRLAVYSQRIEGAVVKMNEMVSSFLYGSSRQLVNPEDLINYIQAQIPMEDDKLRIDIAFDEPLPKILVNKVRVVRAIINILENAIVAPYRHPTKDIFIAARAVDEGLKISITDNGIGISKSDLAKVWDLGYSTGKTTGLGLPIVKQIIEENGGTVKIDSEINAGTTVTVVFPAAKDEQKEGGLRRDDDEVNG